MSSQEIIALITNNDELKNILSHIVDKCNGELSCYIQTNYDDDDNHDLVEAYVYSDSFTKKQLDVLFKYAWCHDDVYYNKRVQKLCVNIEFVVNKAVV